MKYARPLRRYAINSTWMLAEKAASLAVGVVTTALVARYLGPTDFGILSYAIALSTLIALIGDFGLQGVVVREIIRDPERLEISLGTTLALKLSGYSIALALLWAISLLSFTPGATEGKVIMIVSISLPFHAVLDVVQSWFLSQVEARYVTVARLLGLAVSAVYRLMMVVSSAALIMFAWARPLMSGAVAITITWLYTRHGRIRMQSWKFSKTRAKFLLEQSWAAFVGYLFANLYIRVDQIMLRWLVDSQEVALYSVSASKFQALSFLPVALVGSIFPRLVSLRDEDTNMYRVRLQQCFDLLAAVGLAFALALTVTATPLIALLYGEAYAGSSRILIVHSWLLPFAFVRVLFGRWIHIEKCPMLSLKTQSIGVVINIGLNVFLIRNYGAYGAAIATLVAYVVGSYWSLLIYRDSRTIFRMVSVALLAPLRYSVKAGTRFRRRFRRV